jgi:hypothetical protein
MWGSSHQQEGLIVHWLHMDRHCDVAQQHITWLQKQ